MERKHALEKTLKHCLKKKICYTVSLLIGFLITGKVNGAAPLSPVGEADSTGLLDKIAEQKSEIEALLEENEARLKAGEIATLDLLRMGDWYSKPWYPSYFGSLLLGYRDTRNLSKNWVYSTRIDTEWDKRRRDYNDGAEKPPGTGWITGNDPWNDATFIYDNEARLTLIPELRLPAIATPEIPALSMSTPSAPAAYTPPVVSAPAPVTVAVSATVTPPTLPTATAPTAPSFNVQAPDISISADMGAISVTAPLASQSASFTPVVPTFNITQAIAPTIEENVPVLPSPPTAVAPSWTPVATSGGSWLGRANRNQNWLTVGEATAAAPSMHNTFDSRVPIYNYGTGNLNSLSYTHTHVNAPLMQNLSVNGGKFVAINGDISATGRTVTLVDSNGVTLTTAGGQSLAGWNGVAGLVTDRYGSSYTGYTDSNTAARYHTTLHPYASRDANEIYTDGRTFALPDNNAVNSPHRTIFEIYNYTVSPITTIANAEIHIGGNANFMRAYTWRGPYDIRILNSEIHLYGQATILKDLGVSTQYDLDFSGTEIFVHGGQNNFFTTAASTGATTEPDKTGQLDLNFTNNVTIEKQETILLYVPNNHVYAGWNVSASAGGVDFTQRFWMPMFTYAVLQGGLNFSNSGTVIMLGAKNNAIRVSMAVTGSRLTNNTLPVNKIECNIDFGGDQNVGIYLAGNTSDASGNGIFVGDISSSFQFGDYLQVSGTQVQTTDGNIATRPDGSSGDTNKAENSVGIIVDNGQRSQINVQALYPATPRGTTSYNVSGNTDVNPYTGAGLGLFTGTGTLGTSNIYDGGGNVLPDARIPNLALNDLYVSFGKYSKDNIAVVARGGSVVEWNSNASDHAPLVSGTDEDSTAQGSTLAFAEGIWWFSKQRGLPNAAYVWYDQAYGFNTQQGGKYYVPNYRSTIKITTDATVNSIKSVPVYAKDGGYITTKNLTLNGFGSTAAIAFADANTAPLLTGVEAMRDKNGRIIYDGPYHTGTGNTHSDGVHWSSADNYYGPTIIDADGTTILYSGMGRTDTLPKTEVTVDGNIKAQVQGPRRDSLGAILPGSDKVNDNIGIVARVDNGTNGAEVIVSGNVLVNGIAAIASGTGALADIRGTVSDVKTGENGALIAMNAGKIKFGGGTIEHKDTYTGSHTDKPVFYAQAGSNIDFAGATTINMYDGVAFFGASADYTAGAGATRYTNMNNVTVHLRDNGVNLGVFEDFGPIAWNGSTGYLATLRSYPKVALIDDHGFWYKSALEDAAMSVQIDVDRDNISQGSTVGDKFNDITLQKSVVTIENGVTVKSREGNTLAVGATDEANINKGGLGNIETGYVVKGTVDISDTTTAASQAVATFVDYGRITVNSTGKIIAGNGVGAYGVNGSRIENNGEIILNGEGQAIVGLARRIKTDGSGNVDTPEHLGTDGSTDMIPQPDTTSLLVNIINTGKITLTKDNSVAIYADNNVPGATQNRVLITGDQSITVKDNSAGIVLKGASDGGTNAALTGAGGIISLMTGGNPTPDIAVGKNSIGIYAENSSLNVNVIFHLEVKDNSIGVYMPGNSTFSGNTVYFDYRGGNTGSAAGIVLDGTGGSTLTSYLTFEVTDYTGTGGIVSGVYARSLGPLTDTLNSGSGFTLTGKGATAIYSKDVKVLNSGTIQIGTTGNPGGIGIYLEDAALSTNGNLLKVDGTGAAGVYAKSTSVANQRDLEINAGSGPMVINGAKGVGVYVEDTADIYTLKNASNITLANSAAVADGKTGLVIIGSSQNNFNDGQITTGKNNIGAYLKNATLINTTNGSIDVTHNEAGTRSIGIHAEATGGSFTLTNQGTVQVGGVKNIGISLATGTGGSGLLDITAGFLNITAGSMADGDIVAGVYGKGNNIVVNGASGVFSTLGANTVGVYLDGDNTSVLNGALQFDLSSVAAGKIGIGAYFKNGAHSTGAIQVNSAATATNGAGQPVRPVGLYYGTGSTTNTSNVEIISGSQEAVGLYVSTAAPFTQSGAIDVNAKGVGAHFSNTNATNNGNVIVNAADSVGLSFNGGQSTSAAAAAITVNGARSVGVIVKGSGASYENKGTITENAAQAIGLAALDGATGLHKGTITVNDGYGAMASGAASKIEIAAGALISELTTTGKWTVGAVGLNSGTVALNGGNIQMLGDAMGILLSGGKGELSAGNITVGTEGIGIYAENAATNFSSYTGTIAMGNKGVGIYSKNSDLGTSGNVKINYSSATDKGVGIFYDGAAGSSVTNNIGVIHTGTNLVNLYAAGLAFSNTADQKIGQDSVGIYLDGGTGGNTGTLDLDGDRSVGVLVDGGAILSAIGSITGAAVTGQKIGVFVENGDISGSADYIFGISGGIGLGLVSNMITWTGTIKVTAPSVSSAIRTAGVYAAPTLTGTLAAGIEVTGANALGLYLDEDPGVSAADISYSGELSIKGTSGSDMGIGAYLAPNSKLKLVSGAKVTIAGTNNIGFYVDSGADLQITGATVQNTPDGIFAYIKNGTMTFGAGGAPAINYVNIVVDGGAGSLTNNTTITTGTVGLQATGGASLINGAGGLIQGSVTGGRGLSGTGSGTTITNNGVIKLNGKQSVGIYAGGGAVGTSTGTVTAGPEGVAFYADTGGTLFVSGVGAAGEGGAILYAAGGVIDYTGPALAGAKKVVAATVADGSSTIDLHGADISVGEEGTGLYITGGASLSNVANPGKLTVDKKGVGIYLDTPTAAGIGNDIVLAGDNAIGVMAPQNGNLAYNGNLTGAGNSAVGLLYKGTGTLDNNGSIKLTGQSAVGIYGERASAITNSAGSLIEIGGGSAGAAGVAIYGGQASAVNNPGSLKTGDYGVGIYDEGGTVSNTGSILGGAHAAGIYAKNAAVSDSGTITVGNAGIGVYAMNGSVTESGIIVAGGNRAAGIYGEGTATIRLTSGSVTVGNDSVGVASKGGTVDIQTGATISAGEGSVSLYTETGAIENHADLTLDKYGIGIYTGSGGAENYGDITTGISDLNANPERISVGIATETGVIKNYGVLTVPHESGVGMLSKNGGTVENHGTIDVQGKDAYGIQALRGSKAANYGHIMASGDGARGVVAMSDSVVENYGTIDVTGPRAQGIYVETGATVDNQGVINAAGSGRAAITLGPSGSLVNSGTVNLSGGAQSVSIGGEGTVRNIGDITIDGAKVTIDGITLDNIGTITVNGPLDFGTVKFSGSGTNPYVGTISAESFEKGQFIALKEITQGSNKAVHIVQYLDGIKNVPNLGDIGIISESVSYVIDLQKDPHDSNKISIVLVKVPYVKFLQGTEAIEFGKGLDELFPKAVGMELQMFDALDAITEDDELAATFETELRGNIYANIQNRMDDVLETFDSAYESLRHDRLYSKDSLKVGVIGQGGKFRDGNPAIENYDYKTTGFMLLKEYDHRKYGRKTNWSAGFTYTGFDFEPGSQEKVLSVQAGFGFEDFVGSSHRLKYHGRIELTANRHDARRRIHLTDGTYTNRGKYWSGSALWKNKLRYEFAPGMNGKLKTGVFASFNTGYGGFGGFEEGGDGLRLKVKGRQMFSARPGVGADATLTHYTKRGKLSLSGKVSAEYELGKFYDGPNKAKFKGTSADYYNLEAPKDLKGLFKAGVQLKYETKSGHGVGVEVVREEGSRKNTRYGVHFTYRFDQ
jgi:hypothetical protein